MKVEEEWEGKKKLEEKDNENKEKKREKNWRLFLGREF